MFVFITADLEADLKVYFPDIEVKAAKKQTFQDPRKLYARRFIKNLFKKVKKHYETESNLKDEKGTNANKKEKINESMESSNNLKTNNANEVIEDKEEKIGESMQSSNNLNTNNANEMIEDENENKEELAMIQELNEMQGDSMSKMVVKRCESSSEYNIISDISGSFENIGNGVSSDKNEIID